MLPIQRVWSFLSTAVASAILGSGGDFRQPCPMLSQGSYVTLVYIPGTLFGPYISAMYLHRHFGFVKHITNHLRVRRAS